ncbi:MAG: tetratricopeptide repeat protein, partial [Gammaproteobacteria bacterium]|nr:tetratricopeptide repeat protein [Gammaproteobacteria bacterium]
MTAQPYQTGQYKHTVGTGKVAPAAPRTVMHPAPGNAESHYAQGNKLLIAGKLEEAVVSYRRAIELRPALIEAYGNLGVALQALGRLDEA